MLAAHGISSPPKVNADDDGIIKDNTMIIDGRYVMLLSIKKVADAEALAMKLSCDHPGPHFFQQSRRRHRQLLTHTLPAPPMYCISVISGKSLPLWGESHVAQQPCAAVGRASSPVSEIASVDLCASRSGQAVKFGDVQTNINGVQSTRAKARTLVQWRVL